MIDFVFVAERLLMMLVVPTRRARIAGRASAAGRATVAGVLAAAAIAAGCGSGTPAYCSARADLKHSVQGLTSLNLSSGVSGLEAQVKKIQNNATKLVNQAKSDFSSQTQAIKSSVQSLSAAVKGLSSNPSAGQIASVAADASKVVSSVKNFTNATSSKCK